MWRAGATDTTSDRGLDVLDTLPLIGRSEPLFTEDLAAHGDQLDELIAGSRFLVVGGAGTIGAAVTRELFGRRPRALHVVDISENNLAELVRDLRSSIGYISGDFRTYCLDCLGAEFEALLAGRNYDYVLNFSALKHVRSEKDPFTLMRLIAVNVFGTLRTIEAAKSTQAGRYFCVSTDKASNPVNMMGASKRIMEMFLMRESEHLLVSSARFANVIFSDGSLPFSWTQRLRKQQPLVAPHDVRRYFVTEWEGAILCLFASLLGENRDVLFPKLNEKLHLITFSEIAERYLASLGYEPLLCGSEDEARQRAAEGVSRGRWPCYFPASDTTGEKEVEEFYTDAEAVDWDRFRDIGVVQNNAIWDAEQLNRFESTVRGWREEVAWEKPQMVRLFTDMLPEFEHEEIGRSLDDKM